MTQFPSSKPCFRCGEIKILADFYKHPRTADKRLGKCKECAKSDVSANYWKNRDHYIEYERKRGHIRNGKPAKNIPWGPRRSAPGTARRKLDPKPCEICGSEKKVEAHHDDYNKPLEVNWLCRKHHLALHGKVAF